MYLKKYRDFINPRSLKMMIGDSIFEMEISMDHEKGLSGRDSIENDGMVFVFPNPSPKSFHMKNCKIPLDIAFCNSGKVVKIYKNCPPCKGPRCKKYTCFSSDVVLEFAGGYCDTKGITEGQFCQIF